MTHLWEAKHPYYCEEGSYHGTDFHHRFGSWRDFEGGFEDTDLNLLFRWDWDETAYDEDNNEVSNYNGDDYYRNGTLKLFFILQRKARLVSSEVSVCRADEPAVRDWLAKRAKKMKTLWEPLI